jgi:hypothetical protein
VKDFVDSHGNLRERVRALETGAHPPSVERGGFGRNTKWRKLSLASGLTGHVEYMVRSDVVHVRTITPIAGVPEVAAGESVPIAFLGRIAWPSSIYRLPAWRETEVNIVVTVDAGGTIRLYEQMPGTGDIHLDFRYPIG